MNCTCNRINMITAMQSNGVHSIRCTRITYTWTFTSIQKKRHNPNGLQGLFERYEGSRYLKEKRIGDSNADHTSTYDGDFMTAVSNWLRYPAQQLFPQAWRAEISRTQFLYPGYNVASNNDEWMQMKCYNFVIKIRFLWEKDPRHIWLIIFRGNSFLGI